MPKKEVATYQRYAQMSYEDLLHEDLLHALKQMIAEAQQFTISFNATARLNLLPALTVMKDKVSQPSRREPDPNRPN